MVTGGEVNVFGGAAGRGLDDVTTPGAVLFRDVRVVPKVLLAQRVGLPLVLMRWPNRKRALELLPDCLVHRQR